MKNKELYKDEILGIALRHDSAAIDKKTSKLVACNDIDCDEGCLFGHDEDCDAEFIKWLDEEAASNTETSNINPPVNPLSVNEDDEGNRYKFLSELSINETGFLRIIERGYIARNIINNGITFYNNEPIWKDSSVYSNKGYWFSGFNNIVLKNDSFDFIKAGECWAYNTDAKIINKDVIYNITKDLREDYV